MNAAQTAIITNEGDQAHPVLSPPGLLGFLGAAPTQEQLTAAVRLLPDYLTRAVFRDNGQVALLSYGVRLDDLQQVHQLIDTITRQLPTAPAGYRVEITGLPAVAVRGYDLVSTDRYLASSAGVLAAGLVLLCGLRRRRRDALRAILAAVLATGVELLALRLTGTALNPVTVALGSLTAAVGCEFTVLMAESVRTRDISLRRAIALATLTSGVGYAVLGVSRLAVMREFGALLAVSVALSYAAARFVVWVWPPTETAKRPVGPPDAERTEIESKPVVGVS
jgi:predicted RND superfamily exporter protein